VLDLLEARRQLCEHRHERVVDEDDPVLGVVDDVGDLLREQADVQRVQHRSHARHREVQLEVALVVPRERRDALPLLDPERSQRTREAVDPRRDLGVACTRDARAVGGERDDLSAVVAGSQPPPDVVEGQRKVVLHQTFEHLRHPLPAPSAAVTCPNPS
jgi:hypothetical protein